MTERMERQLLDLKARQQAGEHMLCPRCGADTMKEPICTNALSRVADLYVCDSCGTAEAMLAFMKQDYPLTSWAAFQPVRFGSAACRRGTPADDEGTGRHTDPPVPNVPGRSGERQRVPP